MEDFIRGFSELGQGSKVFFILISIFIILLILYLLIQSFRKGEF